MYNQLNKAQRQTRLLHLQPDRVEAADLCCDLSTISLNDRSIQYEALSYVWGERGNERTIYINGTEHRIRNNLYHALVNLRLPDRKRTLWIDAICIDQSSNDERNYQVAQMRYIYSGATNVIIWLGQQSKNLGVDTALEFFEKNAVHQERHNKDPVEIRKQADDDDRTIWAVTTLLSSSWFSRIWTVQEWVLARSTTVHCGKTYISGDAVHYVVHNHLYNDITLQQSFELFSRPIRMVQAIQNDQLGFLSILSETRYRHATDPRDKIYGILALLPESEATLFMPDYSMPIEELLESWARAWVSSSENLDILSHIVPYKASMLDIPSFAPDWTMELTGDNSDTTNLAQYWPLRNRRLHMYSASKGTSTSIQSTPGKLYTRGSLVDTIRDIGECSYMAANWATETYKLAGMAISDHQSEASVAKNREAYLLTLCGGLEWDPSRTKDARRHTSQDTSMIEKMFQLGDECEDETEEMREFTNLHYGVAAGRYFAVTEKRRLSLVPMAAVMGDSVALLAGASVPIVLRRCIDGYKVIGDAYVHGIMDGEAWPIEGELEEIVLV
jgi:hypothetical protein